MPTVIKCIVPDKRAIEVLRLLKPYALDPPVVEPMDEGLVHNQPAVRQRLANGMTITEMVFDYIKDQIKAGGKVFTASELRGFCAANGAQYNSYSYPLKRAIEEGLLKKSKMPATYEVIK